MVCIFENYIIEAICGDNDIFKGNNMILDIILLSDCYRYMLAGNCYLNIVKYIKILIQTSLSAFKAAIF